MLSRQSLRREHRPTVWRVPILGTVLALTLAACGSSASPAPSTQSSTPAEPSSAPESVSPTATPIGERTFDAGYGAITLTGVPTKPYAWGLQSMDTFAVLGIEPVAYTARKGGPIPDYLDVSWPNAVQLGEPPALEQVVALAPDVIISDEGNDNAPLEDIAPVLIIRSNAYQDALDQLALIGDMFDVADVAQAFIADFEATLADTQAKIGEQPAVSSMVIYPGAEPGVLGMWLDTSFTGSLISALGTDYALKASELGGDDLEGDNAERAERFGLVQLGLEKVIDLDPDVLFLLGDDEFVASMNENPAWSTLSAVQNDRVYTFDRNLWSRDRGPIAAMKMVLQARHALYPDIFAEE